MEWKTRQPDPTPEEIRERCREIRETWDEHRWRREYHRQGVDLDSPVSIWVEAETD